MLLEEPILPDPLERLGFTRRDRAILALARRYAGDSNDFGETLRALRAATEELIPAGRIYLLARYGGEAIIGSIVSGVGIMPATEGVQLARVRDDAVVAFGSWQL